jgi:hypothetical protein
MLAELAHKKKEIEFKNVLCWMFAFDAWRAEASLISHIAANFANFRENSEKTLLRLSGAWGKMFHEKNLKQNFSRRCPFK